MTQGKDFLYFLYDADTLEFYYVDKYLNVYKSTNPRPINYGPDGWQEVAIMEEASDKYWGFDRSFTIPLNWVQDGARIIKKIMYEVGYEAKIWMLILEQKLKITNLPNGTTDLNNDFGNDFGNLNGVPATYKYYYDILYRGELDLSTFSHKGALVTVNAIDGGLAAAIKANENTVYQIPVNGPNYITVLTDGMNLKASSNYISIDEAFFANVTNYNLDWLQLAFVNNDGTVFDTEQTSTAPLTTWHTTTAYDDNRFLDNYFFIANAPLIVNFKAKFDVTLTNGNYVKLYLKNSNGTRIVLLELDATYNDPNPSVKTLTIILTQSVNLLAGEKLYLISETMKNGNFSASVSRFKGTDISIQYTSRYKPTYTKGRRPLDILSELISQASDGKYGVVSNLLTGMNVMHTCGDAVRGIEGAMIKTSLSDFYASYDVRFNIGMGIIQDKLTLEKKEFWITGQPSDEIYLGEVSNLEVTNTTDLEFSSLKIGTPPNDTDIVNGKQEPNTTLVMVPPSIRVPKEFDLIGSYRTDPTGIEDIRINLAGKTTTDDASDNDNILLNITKNPVAYFTSDISPIYGLDRTLNAGASGLIDPEGIFNLFFSPKRCFNEHGWYFHSVLPLGAENYSYKFASIDKNADMVAGGIVEKADVPVADLAPRKFLPFYFNFSTRVPKDYLQLVLANPIRIFKFTYKGLTLRGIGRSTGIEPSSNKTQTYKLLATADNDMTKLIKINE